jgi:flagellar biosynthetic protein FliR
VRLLFAILLAFAIAPVATIQVTVAHEPISLLVAVMLEAGTGLTIGFVTQFLFWSVQFAADILGFQMGLSMAQVYSTAEGLAANPIGRFVSLGLLMVFILVDGPQDIIRALAFSLETVPVATANLFAPAETLVNWAGSLFSVGIRFASPFIVSFLLVEFSLGVFARVVPQADLFSLGLPIKLMVGLLLTLLFSRSLFTAFPHLVADTLKMVSRIINLMAG